MLWAGTEQGKNSKRNTEPGDYLFRALEIIYLLKYSSPPSPPSSLALASLNGNDLQTVLNYSCCPGLKSQSQSQFISVPSPLSSAFATGLSFLRLSKAFGVRLFSSLVHRGSKDTSTATTKIPYQTIPRPRPRPRPDLPEFASLWLKQRIILSFAVARAKLDVLCISTEEAPRILAFCRRIPSPADRHHYSELSSCPVLVALSVAAIFPSSAALLCERPARRYPLLVSCLLSLDRTSIP